MLKFLRGIATEKKELNNIQNSFIACLVMSYVVGLLVAAISGSVSAATGWEIRSLIIAIVGGVMVAVPVAVYILLSKKGQVS